MTEVFEIKEPNYNLRSEASHFKRENVKSTHYGTQNIRETNSLNEFKSLITFWKPDTYPCRLCKNYIAQVDFI